MISLLILSLFEQFNQHSVTPEIAVHGSPVDNFTRSGSRGINLCRFSLGFDIGESITPNWSNTTTIKFEVGNNIISHCFTWFLFGFFHYNHSFHMQHIKPINNEGRSIRSDVDGSPLKVSNINHGGHPHNLN